MVGETNCIMANLKVADCIFSAQSPLILPWNREKKANNTGSVRTKLIFQLMSIPTHLKNFICLETHSKLLTDINTIGTNF